jgi:hypothetical protein
LLLSLLPLLPPDDSLTPHSVARAVATVRQFWGIAVEDGLLRFLGVPQSVVEQIRDSRSYSSEEEKRVAGLQYCLQTVPSTLWRDFGLEMDVPGSIRNKIESQLSQSKERKAEVLRVISTEHPHLTWDHVSDVLYQLRGGGF